MQHLEVSGVVRRIYGSLGVKRLNNMYDPCYGNVQLHKGIELYCIYTLLNSPNWIPFYAKLRGEFWRRIQRRTKSPRADDKEEDIE